MKPNELTKLRKRDWEELSTLADRARGNLGGMSEADLRRMGALYRAATSDLALARRDFAGHEVTVYLNQLVGRVYPLIYRGEPLALRRLGKFYATEYPRLFRSVARYMVCAALLFYGPALLLYLITLFDVEAAKVAVPEDVYRHARSGFQWWRDLNNANQVGSAVIMTNNIRVALLAFAGGMLAGLMTVYITISNGLSIGGVFGVMQHYGEAGALAEFVIGHGVLELNEITMASASGLMIGHAMLQPGLLSRGNALMAAARKAAKLLVGSLPLLVIAGLIEGFISPSESIPAAVKYAIGSGSGIALYGYLLLGAKSRRATSAPDSG